jgi:hypothetical protein
MARSRPKEDDAVADCSPTGILWRVRTVSKFRCRLAAKRVFPRFFSPAVLRRILINRLFLLNFFGWGQVEMKKFP